MAESYLKRILVSSGVMSAAKINYTSAGEYFATYVEGTFSKYGSAITSLSQARMGIQSASTSSYAIFGGGASTFSTAGLTRYSNVDAYNSSLTRSIATSKDVAGWAGAAASVGGYVLFASGGDDVYSSTVTVYNTVNAYDDSLTKTTPTALSVARNSLAGASIGNYALFAGGRVATYSASSDVVDAYNTSLTRSTPTVLSNDRRRLAAASNSTYAVFFGGLDSTSSDAFVDAYDSSLTRTTPTALSAARYGLAATNIGENIIVAGGFTASTTPSAVVDIYNSSLTRSVGTSLGIARGWLSATNVDGYAVFAGGANHRDPYIGDTFYNYVDVYDSSLARTAGTTLATAKAYPGAGTIGDYAIFAGGVNGSTPNDTVEAYYLAPGALQDEGYRLTVPTILGLTSYSYSFNELGTGNTTPGSVLEQDTQFTGYLQLPSEISSV